MKRETSTPSAPYPAFGDDFRAGPASTAEIDHQPCLESGALPGLEKHRSGAARGVAETDVVDAGEIVPVGEPLHFLFLRR
jgi:hypothetical protein